MQILREKPDPDEVLLVEADGTTTESYDRPKERRRPILIYNEVDQQLGQYIGGNIWKSPQSTEGKSTFINRFNYQNTL